MTELGVDSIYRSDGFETVYSADTILALGIEEFEFPRSWPDWMFFCGPLTDSPAFSHPSPQFIEGRRHILVSLGTHLWWAKGEAQKLMAEVASRMPDTIIHFTRGFASGSKVEIHNNFHVYDYVSYSDYIDRYDVVMNHGGTGVMYAALSHVFPSSRGRRTMTSSTIRRGWCFTGWVFDADRDPT